MIAALTALFQAATAWLKVWPLWKIQTLESKLDALEDEILRLGDRGDPADKLRIELLAKRKARLTESIRSLRSAIGDSDQGP